MSRALAGASAFAFAVALGEFGATSFMARPETPTLPVVIGRLIARPGSVNAGMALAAAVILAVLCALSVFLVDVAFGGRRGEPGVGGLLRCSRSVMQDVTYAAGKRAAVAVRTSTWTCRTVPCWRCSDRRAAGNRPCCGRLPASSRSPPAGSAGTERIWPGSRVHRRGFGLMFQDGVLFPHRDVAGNIAYGLRRTGLTAQRDRLQGR